MKKTTTKTKSPAPATKAKKPAKTKPAAPAAALPIAAPVPAAAPTPVSKPAPASAQPKPVVPASVQTRIVARTDVGYGNALFVRGDGPGLSWNQGIPMQCVGHDHWELTLGESARPVSFKILLNDLTWCTGPDSVVASGSTVTLTPEFLS